MPENASIILSDSASDDPFDDDDNAAIAKLLTDNVNNGSSTYTYEELTHNDHGSSPPSIASSINHDNVSTIIYPTNMQVRDYQLTTVQYALFANVLCAIPTGLGKTFIASTVMLNFFNWTTSNMKIIFMAPTRPLVSQQIKAFVQITGISMLYADILLDKLKKNRGAIWDAKRVFFATPQVVENDLKSGLLDPNSIALLVIDEAHRSKGNYAYTNVVKFLNRFNTSFRVLALTATPGADIESIQAVVENLNIQHIELRTESDEDIAKYIKTKEIEKLDCPPNDDILFIVQLLSDAIAPILEKANDSGIYDIKDPAKINHFMAMEKSQKVIKNPSLSEGLKWSYFFILQLLGVVGQCLRRIHIYGINTFYNYFKDKCLEFTTKYDNKKSTNKMAASFYYHKNISHIKQHVQSLLKKDESQTEKVKGTFSHTKLEHMVEELTAYFSSPSTTANSSAIIFTELRESALEIVRVLENANTFGVDSKKNLLRPHIFIGQSKEKDKFDQDAYLDKIKPKRKKKNNQTEVETNAKSTKTKAKSKSTTQDRPADRLGSSEHAQAKGMNQKTQKELIENFKKGTYNILVATSIGEEGLDIGEVDLIVCFDSTQSPIKNIQRMGRTGRKRDGRVLLLFSSNERTKFESAMGRYEWIQSQIRNSDNSLEYYTPPANTNNNRIVPSNVEPQLEMKFIEIPAENESLLKDSDIVDDDEFLKLATQTVQGKSQAKRKAATKSKTSGKGKGKGNVDDKQSRLDKKFFLPANPQLGFRPVSTLVLKKINGKPANSSANASSVSLSVDAGDASIDLTNDEDFEERETKSVKGNIDIDINAEDLDVDLGSDFEVEKTDAATEKNVRADSKGLEKGKGEENFTMTAHKPLHLQPTANRMKGSTKNNESKGGDDDGGGGSNKAVINFDDFSDDEFSEVSFSEIVKNAVSSKQKESSSPTMAPIPTPLAASAQSAGSPVPVKRSFCDLSSDVFSDDFDDDELLSALEQNQVSFASAIGSAPSPEQEQEQETGLRPAKRTHH